MITHAEFPLYFGIEIQGLSRTLKLHFQGPIFNGSWQHGQYYSNLISISLIMGQF